MHVIDDLHIYYSWHPRRAPSAQYFLTTAATSGSSHPSSISCRAHCFFLFFICLRQLTESFKFLSASPSPSTPKIIVMGLKSSPHLTIHYNSRRNRSQTFINCYLGKDMIRGEAFEGQWIAAIEMKSTKYTKPKRNVLDREEQEL